MTGFRKEDKQEYTDLATVESQRNDLVPEEFPEGPYGSGLIRSDTLGKSTPWREDQRSPTPFGYENRELHEGMPRVYPGEDITEETASSDASDESTREQH